jgi:hypothetical protein
VPGKLSIYAVGDAAEEHITWRRKDAQLVAMEKQSLSRDTHGRQEIFIKKGFVKFAPFNV